MTRGGRWWLPLVKQRGAGNGTSAACSGATIISCGLVAGELAGRRALRLSGASKQKRNRDGDERCGAEARDLEPVAGERVGEARVWNGHTR